MSIRSRFPDDDPAVVGLSAHYHNLIRALVGDLSSCAGQAPPLPCVLPTTSGWPSNGLSANAWAYFSRRVGRRDHRSAGIGRGSTGRRMRAARARRRCGRTYGGLRCSASAFAHPYLHCPGRLSRSSRMPMESARQQPLRKRKDTCMVLSTQASVTLEEAAQRGQRRAAGFQLYLQPEREATLSLVRRAEAAGYAVLGRHRRCADQRRAQSRASGRIRAAGRHRC